jgi:hypothetical protein
MPRTLRRIIIFVAGLILILTGLVLVVLPGPLTIPPIVAGVWLWSTEFEFARRWLAPVRRRGAQAMAAARERPVHTTVITVLGLIAAGLMIWAALHYHLLGRGADAIGLG